MLRQCMSKVYCISYSDFGALITDGEFDISIVRLDEFDYPVYEDVLLRGKLHVKRRFLNRINSVFDEDAQYEAELPSEIKRLELSYDGCLKDRCLMNTAWYLQIYHLSVFLFMMMRPCLKTS